MWIWSVLQLSPDRVVSTAVGATARRTRGQAVRSLVLAAAASGLGACLGIDATEPPEATASSALTAARDDDPVQGCDWGQWGGDAEHTGSACKEVDHFDRISAQLTFDPFVAREGADSMRQLGFLEPHLFTHFQVPLLVDNNVYMELKAGTYTSCDSVPAGAPCGNQAWNTQVWTERAFHWSHGRLITDWTFASDWKPEPSALAGWEPVFHAIVVGPFVYVPGASGSLHKLDRRTGHELATIRLPGVGHDPNTFVAGGIAADGHGNLYYNALALSAVDPVNSDPRGAWLVKVRPDNTVTMAAFSTIAVGAPAANAACVGEFTKRIQLPFPHRMNCHRRRHAAPSARRST